MTDLEISKFIDNQVILWNSIKTIMTMPNNIIKSTDYDLRLKLARKLLLCTNESKIDKPLTVDNFVNIILRFIDNNSKFITKNEKEYLMLLKDYIKEFKKEEFQNEFKDI